MIKRRTTPLPRGGRIPTSFNEFYLIGLRRPMHSRVPYFSCWNGIQFIIFFSTYLQLGGSRNPRSLIAMSEVFVTQHATMSTWWCRRTLTLRSNVYRSWRVSCNVCGCSVILFCGLFFFIFCWLYLRCQVCVAIACLWWNIDKNRLIVWTPVI